MSDGRGLSAIDLYERFCKECSLNKAEYTPDELDVCNRCHTYRRVGRVEGVEK